MQLVEMDMMMLEKLKTFSEQKEEENLSLNKFGVISHATMFIRNNFFKLLIK